MKQEFNKSILKLDSNQYAAVFIEYKDNLGNYIPIKFTDEETNKTITSATKKTLVAKYGSVEGFFENLFAKGIKDLRITDRCKNGSTYKSAGTPYEVTFESPNEPAEKPQEVIKVQEVAPIQPQLTTNYGMMGANGLSGADIHKVFDHERLRVENSELKVENRSLIKENRDLYDKNRELELLGAKSVEKSKAQADLLEKGTGYMPIILKMLEAKNPTASVPGLSGAPLSELKQAFVKMPDEVLEEIYPVMQGYTIPEFQTELDSLLKKYKLIQ
jgi:hypothetical protein